MSILINPSGTPNNISTTSYTILTKVSFNNVVKISSLTHYVVNNTYNNSNATIKPVIYDLSTNTKIATGNNVSYTSLLGTSVEAPFSTVVSLEANKQYGIGFVGTYITILDGTSVGTFTDGNNTITTSAFSFIGGDTFSNPTANIYCQKFAISLAISKKYLIKQNGNYYAIKSGNYDSITNHNFNPLVLVGGTIPNKLDIDNFGFDDLSVLTNSMTVGSDIFIPISKFDNTAELKLYKG